MRALLANLKEGKRDLLLVVAMVGVLLVLFVPIPPALLDLLLVTNFSLALLILLLTFYTDKPLSFSTFPSLLLMATLFRLALNISATRLILDGADAGHVIEAVGSHVVGGNYVIGLVVFLILVVVQYVVVTNGAQRVAEVAARFTLDSMPGKQMAIDADMNMGLIDEHEARRRRGMIEKEANFYGAMDGATKFVKGDAIAGIIIILIDIIGGLAVGIAQAGMSWGEALHTYTLLTVGDGIVTQIPSLVIAVATGIIITRAATDAQLGEEITRQVAAHPRSIMIVAIALGGLMFVPGLPFLPVAILFAGFVLLAMWAANREEPEPESSGQADQTAPDTDGAGDIYADLEVEPLRISLGRDLAETFKSASAGLDNRLARFRRQYALDSGLVIPPVTVQEANDLGATTYRIELFGDRAAEGHLAPGRVLAINPGGERPELDGEKTKEPTYGLPALWIDPEDRQFARGAGYTLVEPETVLLTHFTETVRRNAAELLTRAEVERLVARVRDRQPGLVEELVPNVLALSDIQKVLKGLLTERVGIRNLEAILEVLVDRGRQSKDPDDLIERVRERLGAGICQALADDDGEVRVLTLRPELEQRMVATARQGDGAGLFTDGEALDGFLTDLADRCEAMMSGGMEPAILCPASIRRRLRQLTARTLPHITVLGLNEVPTTVRIRTAGVVGRDAMAA